MVVSVTRLAFSSTVAADVVHLTASDALQRETYDSAAVLCVAADGCCALPRASCHGDTNQMTRAT